MEFNDFLRKASVFVSKLKEFTPDDISVLDGILKDFDLLPNISQTVKIVLTDKQIQKERGQSLELKSNDKAIKISFLSDRIDVIQIEESEKIKTINQFIDYVQSFFVKIQNIYNLEIIRLALFSRSYIKNESIEQETFVKKFIVTEKPISHWCLQMANEKQLPMCGTLNEVTTLKHSNEESSFLLIETDVNTKIGSEEFSKEAIAEFWKNVADERILMFKDVVDKILK